MASNQYNPRRQQQAAPKKKKRSGASSNNGRAQIPGWMWLVAGVAVGVFVSFLVKLAGMPAGSSTSVAIDDKSTRNATKNATLETAGGNGPASKTGKASTNKTDNASSDTKAGANAETKSGATTDSKGKNADKADAGKPVTKFDFYTLLPEREVIVPNEREAIKPADKPKTAAEQAAATAPEEPLFLQVGSFRAAPEADKRRAQIILLGLEAKVETVQANGDTWYRVQAGPFTSREKLSKARNQLSGEGIESLLVKQKPQG